MAKKEISILTSHQREVLEALSNERYFTQRFYLAGGTALSEFYLKHRLSEDLDLFNENDEIVPFAIDRFFKKNLRHLGIKNIETKTVYGLYTLFLHFQDNSVLKVDFNYYPFPRIEKGKTFNNLAIESIYDIGVDKVHTIVTKPRARDFIDIFFIVQEKGYNLEGLLMQAKAKFDWDITLVELGARFVEGSKMTDFPRMIRPIDHKEWQNFFINEAKKLKKDIFN